ncbi:MAG: hypothetical protein AB7P03_11005 [Kofleriaceae bacterium]
MTRFILSVGLLWFGAACSEAGDAELLVTGLHYPNDLAIDGEFLYWNQYDGAIRRIPVAGGEFEELVPTPRPGGATIPIRLDAYNLSVVDGRVYWSLRAELSTTGLAGGQLWTTTVADALAGGAPQLLAEGLELISDIAADPSRVCWTTSTQVVCAPSDLTTPSTVVGVGVNIRALALRGTEIYWADAGLVPGQFGGGALRRGSVTGGAPSVIATGLHRPTDLAIGDGDVLWSDDGTCTLNEGWCYGNSDGAVRLVRQGTVVTLVTGLTDVTSLASDGEVTVFTSENVTAVTNQLHEITNIADSDLTRFPSSTATHGDAVFWVNSGTNSGDDGSIGRASWPP